MISTSQERASHLARAIFCWLPPLSPAVRASSEGVFTRSRSTNRRASVRSAARRTQPRRVSPGSAASTVFSRQLRPSTRPWRLRSSGTRPRPAASAAAIEPHGSSLPPTVTRPVAAGSRPKIACATSLRPAPTMPATPTISPARTSRLMSWKSRPEDSPCTRSRQGPGSCCRWAGVRSSSSRPIICVTT